MILLIDNYDSFSFNLYQFLGEWNPDILVVRNDEMMLEEIQEKQPNKIVLSPGPGRPEDAGNIIDVVKTLGKDIPILGVCLGHQAICSAFGASIVYAGQLMHGKQSEISLDLTCPLFHGCKSKSLVGRYHSLAAAPHTLPDSLKVTALTSDGEIMGVQHQEYPIFGVQFHPEFKSRPNRAHPLFKGFIAAALKFKKGKMGH